MKRAKMEWEGSRGLRHWELVAGAEGTYWQARDGMVVQVAAAENPRSDSNVVRPAPAGQGQAHKREARFEDTPPLED